MRKIDIHCHTTNRKVDDVIPKSASIDAITAEMREYNIEKTVVLASYFPHKGSGISNFRLHHWIRNRPEFCMFGSLDFEHYFWQGINELNELAQAELIKGIKLYTCYQNIDLNSGRMHEVASIARTYSLPLMFHVGHSYSCMRKYGKVSFTEAVKPADLEGLVQVNQDVNFIISHLAKPFLPELIQLVRTNPNVYTDMSGLIDSKYDRDEIPSSVEDIHKFLGECGPGKLLFGTDFPVQTHADSVYFAEQSLKGYPLSDKQKVYYGNARRLLK